MSPWVPTLKDNPMVVVLLVEILIELRIANGDERGRDHIKGWVYQVISGYEAQE